MNRRPHASRVNRLVENLIGPAADGATTLDHHSLWDKAVAVAEAANERGDSSGMSLIDFVAQTYNGGIEQVVTNGHVDTISPAQALLQGMKCKEAKTLNTLLRASYQVICRAANEWEEYLKNSRSGDGQDEEEEGPLQSEPFLGVADALEDWIYDKSNMDPIFAEYGEATTTLTAQG